MLLHLNVCHIVPRCLCTIWIESHMCDYKYVNNSQGILFFSRTQGKRDKQQATGEPFCMIWPWIYYYKFFFFSLSLSLNLCLENTIKKRVAG